MTEFLKSLLHDYGLLYVSILTMDKARAQWSNTLGPIMSDDELAALPIAKDEPVIVVKVSKSHETDFLKTGEHDIQLTNKESNEPVGDVSVLELPEDEFYFFRAFRSAYAKLATELPDFFLGMCLVHTHGLFEHYMTALLRSIFLCRPEMLGKSKTLNYGDVIESYPSIDALLGKMAEKELRELFYKSFRDILGVLRDKLGFKQLPITWDEKAIEFSLIRNCLVHNRGLADVRMETEFKDKYKCGASIVIDSEVVFDAINTYRKFAAEIDKLAEAHHFKKQASPRE